MIEEILVGLVFLVYALIAFIYSVWMENNKALQQVHKIQSDHIWSEMCFKYGIVWPVVPIINFIIRRKNEFR